MFSGKRTKRKIQAEYDKQRYEASFWKQKSEDYLWLIETYIPLDDLPLWRRISHQRKELKHLLDTNKKLAEQVERLQRG